jgi:hypothetical protein
MRKCGGGRADEHHHRLSWSPRRGHADPSEIAAKQIEGVAEDLYCKAKDAAGSITDVVRETIEERA